MKLPRRPNLVAGALFLLSGIILAWTIYTNLNIDVIDDKSWRLVLPEGDIHAGQTIYVKSEYKKLRQVKGEAERYVECKTKEGIQVSYLVSKALADRAAGIGGTGLPIPIPANIPDLPARCTIRVVINYPDVMPLHDVTEVNSTKEFTLLSADDSSESPDATRTNQPPGQSASQLQDSSVSSLNSAPAIAGPQSEIPLAPDNPVLSPGTSPASPSTPSPAPSPQPTSPSLLQRLQNAVQGIPLAGRLFP